MHTRFQSYSSAGYSDNRTQSRDKHAMRSRHIMPLPHSILHIVLIYPTLWIYAFMHHAISCGIYIMSLLARGTITTVVVGWCAVHDVVWCTIAELHWKLSTTGGKRVTSYAQFVFECDWVQTQSSSLSNCILRDAHAYVGALKCDRTWVIWRR